MNHQIIYLKSNQLLLKPTSVQLKNQSFLINLINLLGNIIKDDNLKNVLLTVQGLETLQIFSPAESIEQFLMNLHSLSNEYKQININLCKPINKGIEHLAQKLSTCIIEIKQRFKENSWNATLFVRRYTGFSNEENYTIQLKDDSTIQVQKRKEKKEEQKPDIGNLGFEFSKNAKQKQQQQLIKNIIYPYLNVQQNNSCSNCECEDPKKKEEQQLIVLDQQQQDEDDVDV